jgi:hypothetical protein
VLLVLRVLRAGPEILQLCVSSEICVTSRDSKASRVNSVSKARVNRVRQEILQHDAEQILRAQDRVNRFLHRLIVETNH